MLKKNGLIFNNMNIRLAGIGLLAALLCVSGISIAAEGTIGEKELFVEGNKWEFKNKENKVVIVGEVKATSPNFILWCDHLTVLYSTNQNTSQPTGLEKQKLEEVHAEEGVIVDLMNGYIVTSDLADYSKRDQKIIFTGHAKVKSETSQMEGCAIIYDLEAGSYSVESCPEQRNS